MNKDFTLEQEKEYFLKNQFWAATISASFARAKVYTSESGVKITDNQKNDFKKALFKCVEGLVETEYLNRNINEVEHIKNIQKLQECVNAEHISILPEKGLKFGVAQKLLNLYLKYLWCSNKLKYSPPHFPLDRLIQENNVRVNWTDLKCDEKKYSEVINDLCKGEGKAEWELVKYNSFLR